MVLPREGQWTGEFCRSPPDVKFHHSTPGLTLEKHLLKVRGLELCGPQLPSSHWRSVWKWKMERWGDYQARQSIKFLHPPPCTAFTFLGCPPAAPLWSLRLLASPPLPSSATDRHFHHLPLNAPFEITVEEHNLSCLSSLFLPFLLP